MSVRLAGDMSDLVLMLSAGMVLVLVDLLLVDGFVVFEWLGGFCRISVLQNVDLGRGDAASVDLLDGQ